MQNAIGFLECNSVAKGLEAADAILKAADVELAYARPCCPGKFCVLFSGLVAAVDAALEAGKLIGGDSVVDSLLIPRVHPEVIRGLYNTGEIDASGSIGIAEFYSVTATIAAADCMLKTSDVSVILTRLGIGLGGKSFVVIAGDTSSVQVAIEAVRQCPEAQGMTVDTVVIAHPTPALLESIN